MDLIVDIGNAAQIFQAARHPKSFISLDNADHLLTRSADSTYAAEVISAWATRYVAKPPPRSASEPGEVVVEETGEGNFQVEVLAGGARFLADEPVEVGGLGSGPTPYDLLCAALGACTAMTIRMYARRKELPLRRVRVCVGHSRTKGEDPPDVFLRDVALEGDLTDEQRSRLIEIAERCPVHASLKQGARVSTQKVGQIVHLADIESAGQHAQDIALD